MRLLLIVVLAVFQIKSSFCASTDVRNNTQSQSSQSIDIAINNDSGFVREEPRKERKITKRNLKVNSTKSSNYVKHNLVTGVSTFEYIDDDDRGNLVNIHAGENNKELNKNNPDRQIIGTDDRLPITNPKAWPYRPTVSIHAYYENLFNNELMQYVTLESCGTGFLVGSSTLITAGHIVYGDKTKTYYVNNIEHSELEDNLDNPRFPNEIRIYAALNGNSDITNPYSLFANVIKINIAKDYFYDSDDSDYDWAILELDRNLGDKTGTYSFASNVGCIMESSTIYGYPEDKDFIMHESPGTILYNTNYQYVHNMDTKPGNSGSPIFINYNQEDNVVCGIHTHRNALTNGGTIINTLIFNLAVYLIYESNNDYLVGSIDKTEYGYPDAYTTNLSDSENYTSHTTASGFQFQTKRYRTGFIHNEYIVLSPIRSGIYNAFIKYQFFQPITKIKIQLTHWRELSHEWTYPTETTCQLRVGTSIISNLLDSRINLSTNRNTPTTYIFALPNITDTFVLQMDVINTHNNNDNRGRVCIGDLSVYCEPN